jgi:phage baseplate assembly protein gpV
MSIGMGGSGSYGDDGLWLAYNDTLGKPRVSFVGSTGHFKFTGTDLDIKTGTLALAASNIQLSSTNASMSLGGVPGAAANILLDGANSKIEVGSANKVTIQGGTTDNYMVMGSKSSFTHFDQSTQGIIIGMDSTVPKFEFAGSATN